MAATLGRLQLALRFLEETAATGAALPSLVEIATALDCCDWQASHLLKRLEDRGLIVVTRTPRGFRRSVAARDGSWTLGPVPTGPEAVRSAPPAERRCLRCRDTFQPETRFMFCCDGCRRTNAGEAA
jgi:hypothetical protein